MARRDPDERKAHRKNENEHKKDARDQEQEQEQQTEKQQEPEHVRAQNQLGNQALAALLSPGGKGGGAVEVEMAKKKVDQEKEGQGFGGEDDAADPVIVMDGDLGESWNPTTTHPSDRVAFLEPMPEDELPPEQAAFVDAVRAVRDLPRAGGSASIEPLIQPSPEVLAISTQTWVRAIARYTGHSLAERALAALLRNPGPLLQDPAGRVLIIRARTAALAADALLEGPLLAGRDVPTASLASFVLELEARSWRVRAGRLALGDNTARALARNTLELVLPEADREGAVTLRRLDAASHALVDLALDALLDLPEPHGLVPDESVAADVEPEEEDDPLGLDAVIAEFTGGAPDPREGVYRAFLLAADKLANSIYIARVRLAGVALAVADVTRLWSGDAPGATLLEASSAFDAATGETIALLKDVARAANKRNVAVKTLRAWLAKAADKLADATAQARETLGGVVGGVVPGDPAVPALPARGLDALDGAWADGRPERALPWLAAHAPSLDRDAALAFTRLATAWEPADLPDQLAELRARALDEGRTHLADALGVCLGAVLVAAGRHDDAIALGRRRFEEASLRRNGIVAAEAALLEVEALHAKGEDPKPRRVRAGALVWQMGARGGLTLLARWQPPPEVH